MVTISLCLIVKNEEAVLERCLDSIKDIVDEIIIVDTGSIDNTKVIAEKYHAKIYNFKWCDDFAKARNYAFSFATKDYILWLDADDFLPQSEIKKFKDLKFNLNNDIDAVTMIYSCTRNEKDETIFSLRRNRLVKRSNNYKWIGRVHEYLAVYGNSINSDITIYHKKENQGKSTRNLDIFLDMKNNNEIFTTRDIFYFANELFDNSMYKEASKEYEYFLSKEDSWVEDKKTATFNLYQCYYNLSMNDKLLPLLFNSFIYDTPRADICCAIALTYFEAKNYRQAIFWYKVALSCKPSGDYLGFDNTEFYTFIPAIQLCVCYCNIGDYNTAFYYNEIASIYETNLEMINHNKQYIIKKLTELNMPIPLI